MISIKGIQISAIFAVPFLAAVSFPRKAMVYFYLLALMFAFGIPQANAASCDVTITLNNESTEHVVRLKNVVIRKDASGKRWKNAYDWDSGSDSDGMMGKYGDDKSSYDNSVEIEKNVQGDNCKHTFAVRIKYFCYEGQRPPDREKTIKNTGVVSDTLTIDGSLGC